jgi:hypothetical protein
MAAMAAKELCKGETSFRLPNSIVIQVFIAGQKADQLDESEVSREKSGEG